MYQFERYFGKTIKFIFLKNNKHLREQISLRFFFEFLLKICLFVKNDVLYWSKKYYLLILSAKFR